jgi:hypothetical protein
MLGQLRDWQTAAADEELVAAAKKGDELGFESLAKRHQRRIFFCGAKPCPGAA